MSKVDALQALREARYAAGQAQVAAARAAAPGTTTDAASAPASAPAVRPARATRSRTAGAAEPTTAITADDPSLCGHRSIGSKSCQRAAGHAEKSHRYK